MELLTIIGLSTLDEAIEAAMNVEASQRIKAQKRDQAYLINTIKELCHEVHNL